MSHTELTYDQPAVHSLVCRLMVSTPAIHVIAWITTHLPTRRDGRLSWPGWLTHSGHLTHELVNHKSEKYHPAKERRPNH